MTSKEQEFKTLEVIKKLVADLGEDSYIGFAMDGVFEMAEENIKNDFACSWRQKADSAEKRAQKAEADLERYKTMLKDARNDIERIKKERNVYHSDFYSAKAQAIEWHNAAEEIKSKWAAAEEKLDAKDLEIMKLKAKLYDMMNA